MPPVQSIPVNTVGLREATVSLLQINPEENKMTPWINKNSLPPSTANVHERLYQSFRTNEKDDYSGHSLYGFVIKSVFS